MNKTKITGILIAILGLLTVLIPTQIFKVCAAMDGKYMKCHWTAQVEVALGIATIVIGLLIVLSKEKAASAYSLASAINGVLVILIPTVVIGVCGSADMPCNSGTKPALIIVGALIALTGLINTALYLTSKNKD